MSSVRACSSPMESGNPLREEQSSINACSSPMESDNPLRQPCRASTPAPEPPLMQHMKKDEGEEGEEGGREEDEEGEEGMDEEG